MNNISYNWFDFWAALGDVSGEGHQDVTGRLQGTTFRQDVFVILRKTQVSARRCLAAYLVLVSFTELC